MLKLLFDLLPDINWYEMVSARSLAQHYLGRFRDSNCFDRIRLRLWLITSVIHHVP